MVQSQRRSFRRTLMTTTILAGSLSLGGCFGSDLAGDASAFIGRDFGFRSGGGGLPIATYDTDPEYLNQPGLATVNASSAYASGATGYTGSGIVVAVIDSGIDADHPEFLGSIHPNSTSFVGGSTNDIRGHGTWVAGTLGANRDGNGMHGIAFNSTILSLRTDTTLGAGFVYYEDDLAAATNYAVGQGADIINYSLGGGGGTSPVFANALNYAAANDTLLVVAAGNDGFDEVSSPAAMAADPSIAGTMIAAGAYDDNINDIASFSNRAGAVADFYLMAPGVDIYVPATNGGYTYVDGTSFAAPMIAGAAAIMKERFPALTAAQIVQLLLTTATDLGDPGVDPIYGNGLMNLALAAAPLGAVAIPAGATVDSGGADPADSSMAAGAAFGDAFGAAQVLAQAIFLDSYDRDYPIDLASAIAESATGPDLLGFVTAGVEAASVDTAYGPQSMLQVVSADDGEVRERWRASFDAAVSDIRVRFHHRLTEGVDLSLSQGENVGAGFGLAGSGVLPSAGLLGGDAVFEGMAGNAGAAVLATDLGEGFTLRLGVGVDDAALGDPADGDTGRSAAYLAEVSRTAETGSRFGLRLGQLSEDGRLLESRGEGAFALEGMATTSFVSAFGVVPVSDRIEVFASVTGGRTDAGNMSSDLMADFDGLRSESFSLGVSAAGVLSAEDRVTITFAQPLRVSAGSATVTAPVARTLDGAIVTEGDAIGLAPSGTEIDAEFAYGLAIGTQQRLDLSIVSRLEPDHVEDADPEFHAGIRYRLSF
ncbi:MAG: S8 family serine peptidase [Inquilinus sp.]|nr:S8 family serine peptidase [Inquilinus sp.]